MSNKKNIIDGKVNTYIDKSFSDVGASQQLFDLKEELATNMKEKIADYQSRGMEYEQAFKEAIISMGDLRGLADDMRKFGHDTAKQSVNAKMTSRISTAGIIVGVLLVLFGICTVPMLYFINLSGEIAASSGIFIVVGGILITYSLLTRETCKKYAMNKIRAALYALAIGLILFGMYVAVMTHFLMGEIYMTIGSLMIFALVGIGLFLLLILTGTDRSRSDNMGKCNGKDCGDGI